MGQGGARVGGASCEGWRTARSCLIASVCKGQAGKGVQGRGAYCCTSYSSPSAQRRRRKSGVGSARPPPVLPVQPLSPLSPPHAAQPPSLSRARGPPPPGPCGWHPPPPALHALAPIHTRTPYTCTRTSSLPPPCLGNLAPAINLCNAQTCPNTCAPYTKHLQPLCPSLFSAPPPAQPLSPPSSPLRA